MGQELQRRGQEAPGPNALAPRAQEAAHVAEMDVFRLGDVLAQSGYFADAKQAAQCIVKVLAGRELGFGPVASMSGVHIISGKPTLAANLLAAAVKRSGKYDYRIIRLDDTGCEIAFFERGQQLVPTSVFTMEDAKKAGAITGGNKGTWEKFPRNMMFARALSNGVRWHCPDIFGGPVYTPEEMGAPVDSEGGAVINVSPERPATAEAPAAVAEANGGDNPDELKARVRVLLSQMNEAGHQPQWSAPKLKLYLKEWYMAESLDALSVRDLKKLVGDFEKKLAALKSEDDAERSLAGGRATSAINRAGAQEGAAQ